MSRLLGKGFVKRIHVNQHNIRKRRKGECDHPVLTVKTSKDNIKGDQVNIVHDGKVLASVVFRPDKPLSCGATVWIVTECEVQVS